MTTNDAFPETHITANAVYFDNVKLPGVIQERGVVVHPGGVGGINTVTVTFLVGRVLMNDPDFNPPVLDNLAEHYNPRSGPSAFKGSGPKQR
jgi:hypothetical protein